MAYFDYGEDMEINEVDLETLLNQLQGQHQDRLDQQLERIQKELENRERVHTEITNELSGKLDRYIDRLELLYLRSMHSGRKQLKQKIEELSRELRQEKRNHWLDCRSLEQERRQLLQELDELGTDWILDHL